jgi:hypothetical protein
VAVTSKKPAKKKPAKKKKKGATVFRCRLGSCRGSLTLRYTSKG